MVSIPLEIFHSSLQRFDLLNEISVLALVATAVTPSEVVPTAQHEHRDKTTPKIIVLHGTNPSVTRPGLVTRNSSCSLGQPQQRFTAHRVVAPALLPIQFQQASGPVPNTTFIQKRGSVLLCLLLTEATLGAARF